MGEASSKESLNPKSRGLLFHCHGGGFVAQSSRSHETYLRQWAQAMAVPILSVDYSLAPEAPFPRALEDTLYAYCWALNNADILGTTAERIVFAGNSFKTLYVLHKQLYLYTFISLYIHSLEKVMRYVKK